MRWMQRWLPFLAMITGVLLAVGCGTFGEVYEPSPDTDRGDVSLSEIRGEVVSVDTVAREIELDTGAAEAEHRAKLRRRDDTTVVGYTSQTEVRYRQRRYRPADLEAGDLVVAYLDEGAVGAPLAERIVVEEAVQDRGPDRETVRGEVRDVDARALELAVETDLGTEWIAYREETPVYYEGEEYRVRNLEPGDLVEVDVVRNDRGEPEAGSVEVTTSVQDRRDRDPYGGGQRARSYDGTVSWVDDRAGEFGLEIRAGDVIRVEIPFRTSAEIRRSFGRLRRGQRVRIEARPLQGDAVELVEFR